jgi:formylglycine-generating enzyme required for sulfatase activity
MRNNRDGTTSLLCERPDADGLWKLRARYSPDLPLVGVSLFAGAEYADWLTRRQGDQPRWRFRLPRDLEWEKAARGADRRLHVWGDYLIRSFCDSLQGSPGKAGKTFGPVGTFPCDESVYGIRDLAGSVSEPVLAQADSRLRLYVLRGGNWDASDPRDYRVATRNRRLPESGYRFVGLRLVAEAVAGGGGEE